MRKGQARLLIGLVILVAGAAVGVYGYLQYQNVRASFGGALAHAFAGGSKAETQAIIEMISGAAAAIIGLGVMLVRGSRGRRR
jgi:hypothetical protein